MRDIYDIITLVNVPTDVATVLKNKHLFYRVCFRLNVRDGRQSQNSSRIVQQSADVLSGRCFVRTAFPVVRGGYEWLWVCYRVVSM